jgi:hypothetical protein
MTTRTTPDVYASVNLEAGLWAVAGAALLALILLTALRPALRRRRKEDPVPCCTPGSLGAHPFEEPDEAGVRRCACGMVVSIPAGASADVDGVHLTVDAGHVGTPVEVRRHLSLVDRTDTREHRWPTGELPAARGATALRLARTRHPSARRLEDADTDEAPLPHVVWPPR